MHRIIKTFIKIKNLSDDFFCTRDIQTIDYCLEIYRQFINNEEFDPFLWNSMEIKLILTKLQPHLVEFKNEIENIFNHFIKLLKSSSNSDLNFDFDKLRKNFIDDSKEQFR